MTTWCVFGTGFKTFNSSSHYVLFAESAVPYIVCLISKQPMLCLFYRYRTWTICMHEFFVGSESQLYKVACLLVLQVQ